MLTGGLGFYTCIDKFVIEFCSSLVRSKKINICIKIFCVALHCC